MGQRTPMTIRARRRCVSRRVRRIPVRRNSDETMFEDDERELFVGGDDKPQAGP
jgi:hypothetical protein